MKDLSTMRMIILAGLALAAGLTGATEVSAQRGHRYPAPDGGFVTAESRFGHGTVSGPVRPGRAGTLEVRMPGGTWITCRRSCSETLRVETVDFWENRGAGPHNQIDNECGLFRCLGGSYRF